LAQVGGAKAGQPKIAVAPISPLGFLIAAMVLEKPVLQQLDQATWESLRSLVKVEVSSQAHLLSHTLEQSQAHVDSRIAEFHGVMQTVDKEHSATLLQLDDRQGHLESKLASLAMDVHKCGATARGELRRSSIELDGKITALGERDDSEKKALENKIDGDCEVLREQQQESRADLVAQIQDLQQQVINDRAERQAIQTRCMHYTDRQVAAAMSSNDLEARFQAVRDLVNQLDIKFLEAEAVVRADLTRYADELCAGLSARMDEMVQVGDSRHADMLTKMDQCTSNARQAASDADKAVSLVDESLHEKVHTASRSLMEQIEAAAARSAAAGQDAEVLVPSEHGEKPRQRTASELSAKTRAAAEHSEKRSQELQAGFYSLVAREALGTEIRALVDRATRRLQVVADDLAQRSATIQNHVVAAEERLDSALASSHRQVAEMNAEVLRLRDAPPTEMERVNTVP